MVAHVERPLRRVAVPKRRKPQPEATPADGVAAPGMRDVGLKEPTVQPTPSPLRIRRAGASAGERPGRRCGCVAVRFPRCPRCVPFLCSAVSFVSALLSFPLYFTFGWRRRRTGGRMSNVVRRWTTIWRGTGSTTTRTTMTRYLGWRRTTSGRRAGQGADSCRRSASEYRGSNA